MKNKRNAIQDTGFGYYRIFYNNKKAKGYYFTVHPENAGVFKEGKIATGDARRDGSIEPCVTIGGKKIRYANYIMNTDTKHGEQCDHIDGNPSNACRDNLRNGTRLQNLMNTPHGVGKVVKLANKKYAIKFPDKLGIDAGNLSFDTKEDAENEMKHILSSYDEYKEWLYENSRAKAQQHREYYEFKPDFHVDAWANTGTLGKIIQFSPNNELNNRLRNLMVESKGGYIYPDEEWVLEQKLKYDYSKWSELQSSAT